MNKQRELEIAMLKLQIVLAESDAFIYYDQVKEQLFLEDNISNTKVEFKNFNE
jgi:hypothetical protein